MVAFPNPTGSADLLEHSAGGAAPTTAQPLTVLHTRGEGPIIWGAQDNRKLDPSAP
eukprot:CAMPEP_0177298006 /NCGR_PEP_ID=MMETSP0368-20130122/3265_1 /TAXON_ID=447022 ORGANISM="Scrippsiella hangoei-like, Strain SHHI-4" /NCGR_SAMPLE_ID=MMETSP0368 /ASSEMBLY_ACC=CAM_ASM_000363 /LENGTH=55 /DNA_ID=CAMNT_0018756249 /DNA_START=167 /DNA_END=335 /DNA_ORIENTATION=-